MSCLSTRVSSLCPLPLIVVLIALVLPTTVTAAEWRLTPRVSASETFSDNIAQAPSSSKEHEFVTQVTPGIGLRGTGGRLKLNFDYQANLSHYRRSSQGQSLQHRLQASAKSELLQDLLFLDVNSTVSQRNQSSTGRQARDNISLSGNREQAVTFGVSPSLHNRFGNIASSELTYRHDEVINSGSLSTSLDTLSLSLSSGRYFRTFPWQISASSRREDNDTGSKSTSSQVNGSVSYAFSRRYSVRLMGGMTHNDLVGQSGKANSLNWRATAIWTPTPRTNFELGYGKQPTGHSISLNATHRMRRAVFDASYSETLTTTSFEQSQQTLFALRDAFGDEIDDPGNREVGVRTDEASISEQSFVARTFTFGASFRGRRYNGGLTFSDTRRNSDRGGSGSHVTSVGGNLSHRLSRATAANAGANFQVSSNAGSSNSDTDIGFNLGISHTINRDVKAGLNYSHQRTLSDVAQGSYKENRIIANVSVAF